MVSAKSVFALSVGLGSQRDESLKARSRVSSPCSIMDTFFLKEKPFQYTVLFHEPSRSLRTRTEGSKAEVASGSRFWDLLKGECVYSIV